MLLFIATLLSCCETPKYKTIWIKKVIVKKYVEQECYNNYGAFRMNHYFLYDDGELEEVSLEDYVRFDQGQRIIITKEVEVE